MLAVLASLDLAASPDLRHVLAPFAEALVDGGPVVRAEFERRLSDPALAKDPEARAAFFYRLHPSHDPGVERHPVLRAGEVPAR